MKPNFHIPGEDLVPAIQSLEGYFRDGGASLVHAAFQHTYFVHPDAVLNQTPLFPGQKTLANLGLVGYPGRVSRRTKLWDSPPR